VGGGPVLIAQCDTRLLLSDVKLVLLEVLPSDAPVTVLRHLGLDDEEVRTVALADLDRDVDPDHLTALLVDSGVSVAARELARLLGLAERLRRPGGCPWDADQTHHSLTRYLLEEAYEVVEAVEALPPDAPAGAAVAAVRAQADAQGGVGRSGPGRAGRRAAPARCRPRRAPHRRRPGPRDPAGRPAGGGDRACPVGRRRRRVGPPRLGGTVLS